MEFDTSREWLETNGIGGFACSTIIGCNTRRYHAFLCAAAHPPVGRMVLVNKLDETISIGEQRFELGCNQYPGTVHPNGYQYLSEFSRLPLLRWVYTIPGAAIGLQQPLILEKTLWMPQGRNTTVVSYKMTGVPEATLTIHPFITGRDYHQLQRYNTSFNTWIERGKQDGGALSLVVKPYANCPSIIFSGDGDFFEGAAWYYSFEYLQEQQRGLDYQEDAWCPGAFQWKLTDGGQANLTAGTDFLALDKALATRATEIERRRALSQPMAAERALVQQLAQACDQFIVKRGDGLHTVVAGYPWFTDWGRDTMISLPGLCLSSGRPAIARSILLSFAAAVSQGMIPNRFPDAGETPDYNTVDATLWFFHAVSEYLKAANDEAARNTLYPVLLDCLQWHLKGTRYGIKADPTDGLLHSGEAGTQLTWMDAKVGDWVVTPRSGKAVEIQALWFNALHVMRELSVPAGDAATTALCDEWIARIEASFAPTFWNEEAGCLFDCVDNIPRPPGEGLGEGYSSKDAAVRPNQILAVSLPHRLLDRSQEKQVVAVVQEQLLTPYGLRSLSPHDSRYCPVYLGDQLQRDGSYHQGTVWAWLIAPFISAYLQVNDHSAAARQQATQWLQPLLDHFQHQACLGSISEIFDGDTPHLPRGCFAQAWSVAEVLRVGLLLDMK